LHIIDKETPPVRVTDEGIRWNVKDTCKLCVARVEDHVHPWQPNVGAKNFFSCPFRHGTCVLTEIDSTLIHVNIIRPAEPPVFVELLRPCSHLLLQVIKPASGLCWI